MSESFLLHSSPVKINNCFRNQLAADGFCHKWDWTETLGAGHTALEQCTLGALVTTSVSIYCCVCVHICIPCNGCCQWLICLPRSLKQSSIFTDRQPNMTQLLLLNRTLMSSACVRRVRHWWPRGLSVIMIWCWVTKRLTELRCLWS